MLGIGTDGPCFAELAIKALKAIVTGEVFIRNAAKVFINPDTGIQQSPVNQIEPR